MAAYRKFSEAWWPTSKNQEHGDPPPKAPKPPKAASEREEPTLGALGGLGGVPVDFRKSEGAESGASVADDRDERAAIIEEAADAPRRWAEGYAALCTMSSPSGFSPDRWRRVVDATGIFLDRWGDEVIRCSWSDLDVFGCHDTAPTARFDCMGLMLLLDRCEIVAIDQDGADLVTASGARQRFRRRPLPPGTVLLWELRS